MHIWYFAGELHSRRHHVHALPRIVDRQKYVTKQHEWTRRQPIQVLGISHFQGFTKVSPVDEINQIWFELQQAFLQLKSLQWCSWEISYSDKSFWFFCLAVYSMIKVNLCVLMQTMCHKRISTELRGNKLCAATGWIPWRLYWREKKLCVANKFF